MDSQKERSMMSDEFDKQYISQVFLRIILRNKYERCSLSYLYLFLSTYI